MRFKSSDREVAEFPERCPVAPESVRFPFEVRQMLYGKKPNMYRIMFTIDGKRGPHSAHPARSAGSRYGHVTAGRDASFLTPISIHAVR